MTATSFYHHGKKIVDKAQKLFSPFRNSTNYFNLYIVYSKDKYHMDKLK